MICFCNIKRVHYLEKRLQIRYSRHALKSRRWLFKHDDDDVQGAEGGKNLRMKNFLIPVTYGHLKIEI